MDAHAFMRQVEQAWRARAAAPAGERLTRLHCHVAAKVAFWRSPCPTHRAIARAARCSTSTVKRALRRLHAIGLLSWTRRVIANRGWRAQVANSYAFNAASLSYQILRTSVRLTPSAPEPGDGDLLIARRAALQERLRSGWRPGRSQ